nr:reverse transcriptase domain-containing protein [Tanacetum cinerariifolium]
MVDQRTMAELLRAPTEGLQRTKNLHNEISNFQQQFDESFHEAWDRYKDLICAFPHHGFTKLHQVDTFYNALNPTDQDSLNSAVGGNLLERRTQDMLTIIKNKSKVHNSQNKSVFSQLKSSDANSNSSSEIAKLTHVVNQQTSAVTTTMTAILKQFQATPPPSSVKSVEEIYVTCGGAHLYYQCLAVGSNTFPKLRDNIQGYVAAAVVNYNQGNSVYRPPEQSYQAPTQQNQVVPLSELEKVKRMNDANMKAMQPKINNVKNELRNEMKNSIQASMFNQTNELKKIMASFFQMNTASTSGLGSLPSSTIANSKGELIAITTRSGIVLDGPSKQQEKDEVQIQKFWKMFKQLHINITLADALILIPKYRKMLKDLLSNKEKLLELENTPLNENCSAVILKKLPEKLRDLGKFLIPCAFSELKCKALTDLGASINLMPLFVWKKLGLPELISTRMTLELANRAICTPAGIARDVYVSVGKFTFPADFVIVDYESDPRAPLSWEDLSYGSLTPLEVKDDVFDPEGGNVIKSLNDNPTPDRVLKPIILFPIPVEDSDSFLKKSDTSLSLLEFETFIDHMVLMLITLFPKFETFYFDIEEKNSGSTTIHADISLTDLECFKFDFKPDPCELTSIVDFEIHENIPSVTNVNFPPEEDHSPLFAYVV